MRALEEAIEKIEATGAVSPFAPERQPRTHEVTIEEKITLRDLPMQGRPVSQRDAAVLAIAKAGHPLTTKELLDLVRAQGTPVGGSDPATNLSSALSRDPRARSIPWGDAKAWWLSDRRIPTQDPDLLESETATAPAKEQVAASETQTEGE
jgi:hypothetical protein